MAFKLNPSKVPIWQTENQLKLGLGESDQVIEAVTTAQERLIHLLFQGIPDDQLEALGGSVGLEALETSELIERLRPSLMENPSKLPTSDTFDIRFAEIIRIGFAANLTPEAVLATRAKCPVLFPQLDRTGLLLTKTLAEAGFGRFVSTDYETVRRKDLGELGYQPGQLGLARLSAARILLENHSSSASLQHLDSNARRKPAVEVFSAMYRINPKIYRRETVPHIGIEYDIDELRISGVIVPGQTACLGCRELWKIETDPTWITTSIQLAARQDSLDDGAGLLLATSIAAKTICQFVDSGSIEHGSGYRVNLRNRSIVPMTWQLHPNCKCRTRATEPGQ